MVNVWIKLGYFLLEHMVTLLEASLRYIGT